MIRYIRSLAILLLFIAFSLTAISQPPPGDDPSQDGDPVSIGGGLLILLGIAGAYGAKKVYDARKRLK